MIVVRKSKHRAWPATVTLQVCSEDGEVSLNRLTLQILNNFIRKEFVILAHFYSSTISASSTPSSADWPLDGCAAALAAYSAEPSA